MAQTKLTFAPLALALGATLALAASCTVQAQRPRVQSAGYVAVGPGQTYNVQSMPPQALYEQQSASPGYGHVWIDGSWHWSGRDWQWSRGHWVRDRAGYVYIAPYYDYNGTNNIYVRGYWEQRSRVPNHYQGTTRTNGRPAVYRQPRRAPVVDHRQPAPRPGVTPPRTGVPRPGLGGRPVAPPPRGVRPTPPPRGVSPVPRPNPRPVAPPPRGVRPTPPRGVSPVPRPNPRPVAPRPGTVRPQPPRAVPPGRGGSRPVAPAPGRAKPPKATAPGRGGSRPVAPAPRPAKPNPDRVRHRPGAPR